jgi:hypothetical protein
MSENSIFERGYITIQFCSGNVPDKPPEGTVRPTSCSEAISFVGYAVLAGNNFRFHPGFGAPQFFVKKEHIHLVQNGESIVWSSQ